MRSPNGVEAGERGAEAGLLPPRTAVDDPNNFSIPVIRGQQPIEVIGAAAAGIGHLNQTPDVDGVLRKMLAELGGSPRVIATGGLAPLIATGSELIELVDDTLTLDGLRLVFERTNGPKSKVHGPKS